MKKFTSFLSIAAMAALLIFCIGCGSRSGKKSGGEPKEESKSLPVSSVTLKGKHANLFKPTGGKYTVSLVNTNDGWEVRAKITIANKTPYDKIKDNHKYECELESVLGYLLNSSDVEIESLDIDEDELDALLLGGVDDETTITCKTYGYHHFTYEQAKEIFDKTVGIIISDIELSESDDDDDDGKSKLFSDDAADAIDAAKDIIEVETDLLKALGGML